MNPSHSNWYFLNTLLVINILLLLYFGILFTIVLFKFYRNSFLISQKFAELQMCQENLLLQEGIEVREQTFQFVSMELHDNVSQVLSLAKLNLNRIFKQENMDQDALLQEAKAYISKSITDISSFSKTLDSETILSNGLLNAIKFEVDVLNKHFNNNIIFNQTGNPPFLDSKQEVIIFRIVQEALNNIVKHAKAKEIYLSFQNDGDVFLLSIKDNGVGFDLNKIREESRFMCGLKNMKLRAGLAGGSLIFKSGLNSGTIVELKIPLT